MQGRMNGIYYARPLPAAYVHTTTGANITPRLKDYTSNRNYASLLTVSALTPTMARQRLVANIKASHQGVLNLPLQTGKA